MKDFHNLINAYQKIKEDIEWEWWALGIYPAFHSPEWFEKLEKYRELKAKKE